MKSKLSKRAFLFIAILTLTAAATFGIGYLIFSNFRHLIYQNFGKSSLALASSVATFIETDIDSYRDLSETEDYSLGQFDETYYTEMLVLFQKLKKDSGATFLYTMKKVSADEFAYVLDAELPESDSFSALGSRGISWDHLKSAFDSGTSGYSEMEYDPVWKVTMMTALAPIVDPRDGEIIGVVGVDVADDQVIPLIRRIQNILVLGMSMFVIVLSIVIYNLFESRVEALELDYLTGLFSKRYFDKRLRLGIVDARLKAIPLSMMMLDVDSFKGINDQFGHQSGDKVLKEIADLLKKSTRRSDVCARYGGDEFAILLPDSDLENSRIVARRIIENLEHIQFRPNETTAIDLSLSIGISLWESGISKEELESRADQAMYHSKEQGKNRISEFRDDGSIQTILPH
jgi:diguanylate cyclase (GGDEF)-like protein